MREQFVSALAIGAIVVAVAVGAILFLQRGAHIDLPGQMTKVRTVSTGENDALVLIDLRITNPSNYPFVVRNVTVVLEKKSGEQFPREIVSRSDTERLFDALPDSGPYHPPLFTNATLAPGATGVYTLAAQFNAPERILQDRKRFLVQIDEIDGKSFEFSEK
jgi:hypothetical protein